MNKFLRSLLTMAVAATAMSVFGSIARAGETSDTIAIKFGVNMPPDFGSMMNPDDIAGVPGVETRNWNNAVSIVPIDVNGSADMNEYRRGLANLGTLSNLVRDTNGVATTTGASVSWSAERTWSSSGFSEENNNFPGDNSNPSPNRKLMLGTLDQQAGNGNTGRVHTNRINITGLPDDMAAGYDVIIYTLGGVGNGRGGTYTVNGVMQLSASGDIASGSAGPDFVQGPGDGSAHSNYLRFKGLSGPTVKIRWRNDNIRAHINAVEIIKTSQ
jgi:hypothetical protein